LRNTAFRVIVVNRAEEALETLAQLPVTVVVADQGLEDGSGLALLREARVRSPGTIRVALNDGTSMKNLVRAVNDGDIFTHLPREAPEALFVATLQEATFLATGIPA
jgi:DNA-binding NtrC family response regulator